MLYLQLNGFRAWVSIDNVPLNHYNVEFSPDRMSVTCWIPSEVGKNFVVNWIDTVHWRSVITHTAGRVTVDGHEAGGRIIDPSNRFSFASISGITTAAMMFRPFVFYPLDLTDDDSYLDSASSQGLGEIILDIWTVVPGPLFYAPGDRVPQPMKLHERSNKGVAHCIRFGPEICSVPAVQTICRKINRLVTFTFKYKSLDAIRANGIVTCEPQVRAEVPVCEVEREPESSALDDDEKTVMEELRVLQEKFDHIRARQRTV